MLYTALNLTTDEFFASNSFKTVYNTVMTSFTHDSSSNADRWSIKKHANLDADNFSFSDVIFSGEEIYIVTPAPYNIFVWRNSDKTMFIFRARYNTGP